MIENNEEQKIAIETIDKNLSVIAGAGTGKTKVLTERFVYILENGDLPKGKEIESIVAITFTKKATGEMIERIRSEIRKNFDKGEKWRRYYRDIEKANISTIHSFCMNILKENAIAAGLDPLFEVIEEYEASKMLRDSILEVVKGQLEEDRDTYNLFKEMKIDRASYLVDDIKYVYNETRTMGIDLESVKHITLKRISELKGVDSVDLKAIRDLVKILIENGSKKSKISKVLDDEECKDFLDGGNTENLGRIISYIRDNIGANKKEQANIDSLESRISIVLKALEKDNINYYSSVLTILEKVDALYKNKKEIFGGLDYEDLQIKTDQLLEDRVLRSKYQGKYSYIMVDEFQDTNMLQKQIFYKIATIEKDLDRNNLFIVGDPKQSIYGFRGADLGVFYNVAQDIEKTNDGISINLSKNYRTVDTVLNFINNIFTELMGENYAALISNQKSEKNIDIEIISKDNLIAVDGMSASEYNRYFEAEQIAKRIRQLVAEGRYRYKDFAMLFRARTRNHIYENALRKYGVAYYNIGSKGFFKQTEILDIINALKSISNTEDKIARIGFLRSNFIGLNDNTIYYVFRDKELDPLNKMKMLASDSGIESSEKEKLDSALDIYKVFDLGKDIYAISQIVDRLLEKTLYRQTILLKENGRQMFANIGKFIAMIKEYESKQTGNLREFLEYIDEIKENDESLGEIEGENTDAVKLLTIHKSKGLEFPVVIIPEMATRGVTDTNKIFFDSHVGLAINFENSGQSYEDIKAERMKKTKEEMQRVLYVAMTRAKKMIIIGNQGRNSGFKKMIADLLDGNDYRQIDEISLEPKQLVGVKTIPEEYISKEYQADKLDREYFPILNSTKDLDRAFDSRISISKYMVFRECKRKYFLESNVDASFIKNENDNKEEIKKDIKNHIEEPVQENLSPIEKGIVIHEFCELYRFGRDKKELVEKILNKNGLKYRDEIYESIEEYIDNYLLHYNEDGEEIYYEKPFFLQLENAYISGYIDKLSIVEGRLGIVDFKTNKVVNKSRLIEKYRPQLQLYAYVAQKILKLPINNASILFLENGERVDIGVSKNELEKNIRSIQKFVDFTRENTSIDKYEKNLKCNKHCKYNSICKIEEEVAWDNI